MNAAMSARATVGVLSLGAIGILGWDATARSRELTPREQAASAVVGAAGDFGYNIWQMGQEMSTRHAAEQTAGHDVWGGNLPAAALTLKEAQERHAAMGQALARWEAALQDLQKLEEQPTETQGK